MAVRRVIPERCPRCGQVQATLRPDGSVAVDHNCPQGPPGPPSYPVTYRACEVDFVPATGEPPIERVRAELKEAGIDTGPAVKRVKAALAARGTAENGLSNELADKVEEFRRLGTVSPGAAEWLAEFAGRLRNPSDAEVLSLLRGVAVHREGREAFVAPGVFANCNVCGCPLPADDRMGMCERCARESL